MDHARTRPEGHERTLRDVLQPQTEQRHAGPLGEPRRTQQVRHRSPGILHRLLRQQLPDLPALQSGEARQRLAAGARMEVLLHDRARRQRRRHEPAQGRTGRPDLRALPLRGPVPPGLGLLPLEQILAGRPGLPRAYLQRAVHADAGERRIRVARSGTARPEILHRQRVVPRQHPRGEQLRPPVERRRLRPARHGLHVAQGVAERRQRFRAGRPVRLRPLAGRVHRLLQPRQRARQRDDLRHPVRRGVRLLRQHPAGRGRPRHLRRLGRGETGVGFRRLLPERRRHGVQMERPDSGPCSSAATG